MKRHSHDNEPGKWLLKSARAALLLSLAGAIACQTTGGESGQAKPQREAQAEVQTPREAGAENQDETARNGAMAGPQKTIEVTPGRRGCVDGDCVNGLGTYVYDTGDVYRGTFQNGRRHGKGVFEYANGDRYEGGFADNLRTGFGTYAFSNGDQYVGEFIDGKLKGIGTYRFTDGTELKGTFNDNGRTGEGTLIEEKNSTDKPRDCTVENRLLFCRN